MLEQERLEVGPGDDEAAEHRHSDDVRVRRLAGEERDLTEEVAGAEPGHLLVADHDGGVPVQDHVERGATQVLAEHALVLREHLLLEAMGDRLALCRGEVGEEREAREDVLDFSHAPSLESLMQWGLVGGVRWVARGKDAGSVDMRAYRRD